MICGGVNRYGRHRNEKLQMNETAQTQKTNLLKRAEDASDEMTNLGSETDACKDTTLIDLGKRIKTLRSDRKLTLAALAERSGVSRAMLSKVERAEKSPTLSIVMRIAGGLDVDLSDLLGAKPHQSEVSIIRLADRLIFHDQHSGFKRELLSPPHTNNGVEVLLHRLPPGKSSGTLPNYAVPTEKYVIVREGELTLHIGDKSYQVVKGDTIHFEIKSAYSFENRGSVAVSYYVLIIRDR